MHDVIGVPDPPEEISAEVVERLEALYRDRLPLIDGALEAVRRIGARWPLAIASSSNRPLIDLFLELTGTQELFRATVSSEEVAHGKPAPDVYLEAATRLEVAAGDAVRRSRTPRTASARPRPPVCAWSRSRTASSRRATRRSRSPASCSSRWTSSRPRRRSRLAAADDELHASAEHQAMRPRAGSERGPCLASAAPSACATTRPTRQCARRISVAARPSVLPTTLGTRQRVCGGGGGGGGGPVAGAAVPCRRNISSGTAAEPAWQTPRRDHDGSSCAGGRPHSARRLPGTSAPTGGARTTAAFRRRPVVEPRLHRNPPGPGAERDRRAERDLDVSR